MSNRPLILYREAIEGRLPGFDPFIFAAYHLDHYPASDGQFGLRPEHLQGRELGMDFSNQDGFSTYHGHPIPGFPAHPHRGFETVTIVRSGVVDHADSLGATARYGQGDVQWLTTGAGIQHGEMFPLLRPDQDNPLDLIQIWLNLPAKNKMAPPEFKIFWAESLPVVNETDSQGLSSTILIAAGDYTSTQTGETYNAIAPPQASWAADENSDVAIWVISLSAGASLTLPAAKSAEPHRLLYLLQGNGLAIAGETFTSRSLIALAAEQQATLTNNSDQPLEILMLQGKPINEPVVARGPFVMNTQAELIQAINDYQQTEFGGWPWPSRGHIHGDSERFAKYPDGRIEYPPK